MQQCTAESKDYQIIGSNKDGDMGIGLTKNLLAKGFRESLPVLKQLYGD